MGQGISQPQRMRLLALGACYLCEQFRPTHVDEVGGNICAECEERKQAVRSRVAQSAGYSRSRPREADADA